MSQWRRRSALGLVLTMIVAPVYAQAGASPKSQAEKKEITQLKESRRRALSRYARARSAESSAGGPRLHASGADPDGSGSHRWPGGKTGLCRGGRRDAAVPLPLARGPGGVRGAVRASPAAS